MACFSCIAQVWKRWLVLGCSPLFGLGLSVPVAIAQVSGDLTLPGENTRVEFSNDIDVYTIRGGAVRDSNLFHSFEDFSLSIGETALFDHDLMIDTIFGRVTGENISNIDGTIGTVAGSTADLFLLNPAGIVFGPNAALDVGGSFFASTADQLVFADGADFSASRPQPVSLTISRPIGLIMGETSGNIVNESSAGFVGLGVPAGETLGLVGNGVEMPGGGLFVPAGRIEVASIAPESSVGLVPPSDANPNWQLDYQNTEAAAFRDIQLSGFAFIDTSNYDGTNSSGTIQVRGRQVALDTNSEIVNSNFGVSAGGDVFVAASEQLRLSDGAQFRLLARADGQGSDLTIAAGQLTLEAAALIRVSALEGGDGGNLTLDVSGGAVALQNSRILVQSQAGARGSAGLLSLTAGNLTLQDGAEISTSTFGQGTAGDLIIDISQGEVILQDSRILAQSEEIGAGSAGLLSLTAGNLTLQDGAEISTSTFSPGAGGDLTIDVSEGEITLQDSRILAQSEAGATGAAGNILLTAGNLTLQDGSEISTSTFSQEAAGNLDIEVLQGDVVLRGTNLEGEGSRIRARSEASAGGTAGDILLAAGNLTLQDDAEISTSTFSAGAGGDLTIDVSQGEVTLQRSRILAQSEEEAEGAAGDVSLTAGNLKLQEGAEISTSTFSQGSAGNLDIDVSQGDVVLQGTDLEGEGSRLRAQSEAGAGGTAGDISLTAGNLMLQDGAEISTSTFSQGSAGNLDIDVSQGDVVLQGTDLEGGGSRLRARSEASAGGAAGDISLTAGNLTLQDAAEISTSTFSAGAGGDLTIDVSQGEITLQSSSILAQSEETAEGSAGSLLLTAGTLRLQDAAEISTSTLGDGNGGNLTVNVPDGTVELVGGSDILALADNGSTGNAGDVTVNASRLSVRGGSRVLTSTFGAGAGGLLQINTPDGVTEVIGEVAMLSANDPSQSSLITSVTEGAGDAGDIQINTGVLQVAGGGRVQSGTRASGDGGATNIVANLVEVVGESDTGRRSWIAAAADSAATGSTTGALNITTGRLEIRDGGVVFTGTDGVTQGGELTITADEVVLSGRGRNLDEAVAGAPSGLFARTEGPGDSGLLTLVTDTLLIQDGARLTVSTDDDAPVESLGTVRDANITARTITLDNGQITAEARSGDGGNLNLTLQETLLLRNNSLISATAGTAEAGGNGGNITIATPDGFVIALPNGNNDIIANAFEGSGGQITITAIGIYGFTVQEDGAIALSELSENELNDISASSQFGESGVITLNALVMDPTTATEELDDILIDPEELIANSCLASNTPERGRYVVIGSGGLPPSLEDIIAASYSTGDVRSLDAASSEATPVGWQPGDPIVEPDQVTTLADGRLAFTQGCNPATLEQLTQPHG